MLPWDIKNKCFRCDPRVLGVHNLLVRTNLTRAPISTTTASKATDTGHWDRQFAYSVVYLYLKPGR